MNNNQQVAKAYAKASLEISVNAGVELSKELTSFWTLINESNNLENLLFLDVFSIEERIDVVNVLSEKLGLSPLTKNLILFLITEKRMNIFPLIYKELIISEELKDGFISGVIEGSDDLPEGYLEKVTKYLEEKIKLSPKLTFKKNPDITAGFKVTVGDLQLDTTIENQFEQLKSDILNK